MKRLVLSVAGWMALSATVLAGERVNVNRDGVALEGHDPVAFFTTGKAVAGSASLTASHQGGTYRFTSAENRDAFVATPEKYAPAYGGFCAYGMSQGYRAPVKIETWQIVGGRLMLNYDRSVARKFNADRDKYVALADANWAKLAAEEAR